MIEDKVGNPRNHPSLICGAIDLVHQDRVPLGVRSICSNLPRQEKHCLRLQLAVQPQSRDQLANQGGQDISLPTTVLNLLNREQT
jgi:hypothetical protein